MQKEWPLYDKTLSVSAYGGILSADTPLNQLNQQFAVGGFGAVPLRGHGAGFVGQSYLVCSLELKQPLAKGFWVTAFLDSGRTWSSREPEGAYPVVTGAGLGLALETPMGYPVRLDLARSLDGDAGLSWNLELDFDF